MADVFNIVVVIFYDPPPTWKWVVFKMIPFITFINTKKWDVLDSNNNVFNNAHPEDWQEYTEHCLRRSSAPLADSGADLHAINCHGDSKSEIAVEVYLGNSIENNKKKMSAHVQISNIMYNLMKICNNFISGVGQ